MKGTTDETGPTRGETSVEGRLDSRPSIRDVVNRIAWDMQRQVIPKADLAALRGARSEALGNPSFWKLVVLYLEPAELLPASKPHLELRWLAVLRSLAAGSGYHLMSRSLGGVMAHAGVTEARVLRLLKASGQSLHDVVGTVVHQLVSGGHPFDQSELAELILSDGNARWSGAVRRRIALNYYRAQVSA